MKAYQIESRGGTVYGIYEGTDEQAAFDAMVADGVGDAETAGTAADWIITEVGRIKLSAMRVGDRGYLASEGQIVELRDHGAQGGCDHDLWLALVEWDDDAEYPTIIVDTEDVSA